MKVVEYITFVLGFELGDGYCVQNPNYGSQFKYDRVIVQAFAPTSDTFC